MKWSVRAVAVATGFVATAITPLAITPAVAGDMNLEDRPAITRGWTGAYLGASVGATSGLASRVNTTNFANSYNMNGVGAGIYGGYNYQINSVVVGIDANYDFRNLRGDDGGFGGSFDATRVNSEGAVRARLGFLLNPSLLVYAAGGYSFAQVRHFNDAGPETFNKSIHGVNFGGGVEALLTSRWMARIDYRHTNYERYSADALFVNPFTVKLKTDDVRVGLAYKF